MSEAEDFEDSGRFMTALIRVLGEDLCRIQRAILERREAFPVAENQFAWSAGMCEKRVSEEERLGCATSHKLQGRRESRMSHTPASMHAPIGQKGRRSRENHCGTNDRRENESRITNSCIKADGI